MADDNFFDEFLLAGIVADQYITKKEAKLLRPFPISFQSPWWESEKRLSAHFSRLIDAYGGDQCGDER